MNLPVLTDKLEWNKHSELCQIVFFTGTRKNPTLFKVTPLQLDLLSVIFYQANRYLVQQPIDLDEKDSTTIELKLKEVSTVLSKYNASQYRSLVDHLDALSNVRVVINALNKNKNLEETTLTRFILSIKLSRHLDSNKKVIRIMMDNEVLKRVHNLKSMFTKMYLTIQFSMNSKYSKLLYELIKDYGNRENYGRKRIDLFQLYDLLNVTEPKMRKWSTFRPHILEKAIKEINEKSDVVIAYEPIKGKPEGQRKQVTNLQFHVKPQSDEKLKILGLLGIDQQNSIMDDPLYFKSKIKLNNMIENGYVVKNEEAWITADIGKYKDQYEAENKLDKWLEHTPKDEKIAICEVIAELNNHDDPSVYIDEDEYQLKGVFSRKAMTLNAKDTMEKLNEAINAYNGDE